MCSGQKIEGLMQMTEVPNVYEAEAIPESAMEEVVHLLKTGDLFRYSSGKSPVALLETDFAEQLGVKYALAVSSCSAALFLSLKSLDLPGNSRVLMPAFTFGAVPSAIIHAGCVPVLCECGNNYRIDLDDFIAKLPNVSAVIISHMRGHTSDMDVIMEVCESQGIPVIEDAAHSIGTTWHSHPIGTLGRVGCFSFQSYKLLNAGEGGIMVTDDGDLIARAVIMSGAYEENWKKHPVLNNSFSSWQNKLPLYNLRLNNLSAVIIRSQLGELERRVSDGRRNHDHVAELLNQSPWMEVPAKLAPEVRAPDSIQFNLVGMSSQAIDDFVAHSEAAGIKVQVFGRSKDNARAYWNWEFLPEQIELPQTRAMLMSACDVRLPARLTLAECDTIAHILLDSIKAVIDRHAA